MGKLRFCVSRCPATLEPDFHAVRLDDDMRPIVDDDREKRGCWWGHLWTRQADGTITVGRECAECFGERESRAWERRQFADGATPDVRWEPNPDQSFESLELVGNVEKVVALCRRYIETWMVGTPHGFYISGRVGVGKTHVANALWLELARKGAVGVWVNAPGLRDLIHMQWRREDAHAAAAARDAITALCECDIMFWDDAGTEQIDSVKGAARGAPYLGELHRILDYRCARSLPIVVTTNLGLGAFSGDALYGPKIGRRIWSTCARLHIDAPGRHRHDMDELLPAGGH